MRAGDWNPQAPPPASPSPCPTCEEDVLDTRAAVDGSPLVLDATVTPYGRWTTWVDHHGLAWAIPARAEHERRHDRHLCTVPILRLLDVDGARTRGRRRGQRPGWAPS